MKLKKLKLSLVSLIFTMLIFVLVLLMLMLMEMKLAQLSSSPSFLFLIGHIDGKHPLTWDSKYVQLEISKMSKYWFYVDISPGPKPPESSSYEAS